MKKLSYLIMLNCAILLIFFQFAQASVSKYVGVGKCQSRIYDTTEFGSTGGRHYHGYYYTNDFIRGFLQGGGWHLACRDWTDQYGEVYQVGMAAAAEIAINEGEEIIPVPDKDGITIHRYFRYQPPTITVDGFRLDEPFPQRGDEVNPDVIPGTADIMVESTIRTRLGVEIHQRVLAWSQTNHDDYIIEEYTFTNTGNVDLDDEIELPNQTLNGLYFMRDNRWRDDYGAGLPSYRGNWHSFYGERPGDSLRISYGYPRRGADVDYDEFGYPDYTNTGYLQSPEYVGDVFLHVDKSPGEEVDDKTQPQMTGTQSVGKGFYRKDATSSSLENIDLIYQTMQFGFNPYDGTPYLEGAYPGTHHTVRMDEMGYEFTTDIPWNAPLGICHSFEGCGPYTLKPGESIKIVWALTLGSLSPEKSWEIGTAWKAGTCVWEGKNDLADYYPTFKDFPGIAPTKNDQAKDRWVCTGKDSLFRNAANAVWNYQHNYNVPIPPPPPSIEIHSLPDGVNISWGSESESAPDFAGYKVYKAVANPGPKVISDTLMGSWKAIFECGEGTANPLTHSYDDTRAVRGQANYYYVAAFDNGTANSADAVGIPGKKLESAPWLNRTTRAAYLTREAGTLSSVRIIPNPFNISADKLQFPGEQDKIVFYDLPPKCTIRIYSESADLIKTIEHTDGSGDESWGVLQEEWSASETGQIVVSGVYIAYIETPGGESTVLKFAIIR
ncbi:MAG: hypothetical protein GXO75_01600 [Calditrichaeota bacterium]|nr:hypothetical protein [Calditrichota bacterium]